MQKGKNMQYATAGVQAAPGMRMNVRSNVRLPDAEAGGYAAEEQRVPYYAAEVRRDPSRRSVTIPMSAGLLFLVAVIVLFGVMILNRTARVAELTRNIEAVDQTIKRINKENEDLALEVLSAQDPSRISFAAQEKKMIAASSVEPIFVTAPDTRPNLQPVYSTAAEESPYSALDGIMTGSR